MPFSFINRVFLFILSGFYRENVNPIRLPPEILANAAKLIFLFPASASASAEREKKTAAAGTAQTVGFDYLILTSKYSQKELVKLIDLCRPPGTVKRESEVKHNSKLKLYPDGNHSLTIASKAIFLERGYESVLESTKTPKPKNMNSEVRSDNLKRAKQKVLDIARLNHFDFFITWTLDQRLINRYDPKEISRKVKIFLNNMVKRKEARYLIIPEYHKDGAIHMHGLLSGNFTMTDNGHKTKGGQTVYNMPDWKLGYSTAIELDGNVGAISRYITKYISKDFRKIFGSFYYAGGHGLNREPPHQLYDLDYGKVNAKEYRNEYVSFKYVNLGDTDSKDTQNVLEALHEAEHTGDSRRYTDEEIKAFILSLEKGEL